MLRRRRDDVRERVGAALSGRAVHRRPRRPARRRRRSTRSSSPRRCRRTPTLARARARGGQALLRREAARASRSPTPSAPSRPRGAAGRVLMVGHLLAVPPGRQQAQGDRRLGRARRHPLHLRQPPEPRPAARRGERAVEPRRARRLGRCCTSPTRSRTSSTRAASPTCARASRTSCSRSCASRRASPRTCTCRGWTRTRSGASRSSARKRMATFDDMDPERKVTVYDKGFDEKADTYGEYITRSGDIWSPRGAERRAAAPGVRALRRVRPRGPHAGLRRRERRCASCACSRACSSRSTRPAGPASPASGPEGRARCCGRRTRRAGWSCATTCQLGDGVLFGPNVLVEEGTRIGEASVIEGGALLGKVPRLARTSATLAEAPAAAAPRRARHGLRGRDRLRGLGRSATRRSSATRRRCASASMIGPQTVVGRGSRDRQRRDDRRAGEDPDATSTSPRSASSRTTSSSARARRRRTTTR